MRRPRWTCFVTLLAVMAPSVRAGDPPATKPARDVATLRAALDIDGRAAEAAMPAGTAFFTDPAARKAAAPALLPALRRHYADWADLAALDGQAKRIFDTMISADLNAKLVLLGDADAIGRLQSMADSKDPAVALAGRGPQLLVQWWLTHADAVAQAKVVDEVDRLAKANPTDVPFTWRLANMLAIGSAAPENEARVRQIVVTTMRNPVAAQLKAAFDAAAKQKAKQAT